MDSFSKILNKLKTLLTLVNRFLVSFFSLVVNFFGDNLKLLKSKKSFKNKAEADKQLVLSLSKSRIPSFTQLKYLKKYLSKQELSIIYACLGVMTISIFIGGAGFYNKHIKLAPERGGKYIEGSVGSPKYINPLYSSLSDIDSDLSGLIYSSLYRLDKNGNLIQDLVQVQTISDDQKAYSFKIREDVKWHDGEKLTVDDIIFTFNLIKNSSYKSPLRANFSGVSIEKIDEYNFKFVLSNPYAAFDELLTFGIMPVHVWGNTSAESISLADWNLHPIGSGPYVSDQLIKDRSGNIKEYDLVINKDYYLTPANVGINFKFFDSFEEAIGALNDNLVDGISYLPQELRGDIATPKTYNFHNLSLPQLNAIFFNKDNNAYLGDKDIRKALTYSINRQELINQALGGNALVAYGPILTNNFAYSDQAEKFEYSLETANKIFNDKKWEKVTVTQEELDALLQKSESGTELSDEENLLLSIGTGSWLKKDGKFFSIKLTTVDTTENVKVVEEIKKYWALLGIKTELEVLPPSQIQAEVIRGRNFEALFYGQGLGMDPDPYAFWHSSQIGESGYNIANFSNKEADQLLEDARISSNADERKEKYAKFQEIVNQELPAIFMYSPSYTYLQTKQIKGFDVKMIINPSDRFSNVAEWYIKTKKKLVW